MFYLILGGIKSCISLAWSLCPGAYYIWHNLLQNSILTPCRNRINQMPARRCAHFYHQFIGRIWVSVDTLLTAISISADNMTFIDGGCRCVLFEGGHMKGCIMKSLMNFSSFKCSVMKDFYFCHTTKSLLNNNNKQISRTTIRCICETKCWAVKRTEFI